MIRRIKESWAKYERAQTIKLLCSADPQKLEDFGAKSLIPAFRRAATRVPAYRKVLTEHSVDYQQVTDVPSYQKLVPVIDKQSTFSRFDIEELCIGGTIKDMKLAMSSSGFSGVFSYGINTPQNYLNTAKSIDTALQYIFDIDRKKTFLVNCIPMGVKVTTSLRIAETSVRADMALALIKKFSHKFDQTLLVSDPHFLKKIVEDGIREGVNWKKINASLIFGEDWFSESFRSYLASLMGIDLDKPEDRFVGATMGIAELDLNLFHESRHSIRIRRLAQNNPDFRKALFGENVNSCPILFHYYPHRIFLEALPPGKDGNPSPFSMGEVGGGESVQMTPSPTPPIVREGATNNAGRELVFSMLSPHMLIPLLRYNSKDRGDIIKYNTLKDILIKTGHADLLPELKLPLVWVGGRNDRFMEIGGKRIYPEDIKQGLYEDFQVAGETTGYFRLNKEKQNLEIQLNPGVTVTAELKARFGKALLKYCNIDLPVVIYPYQEFPYAMVLDYERKFFPVV